MRKHPWLDNKKAVNGRSIKKNFSEWLGDNKLLSPQGDPVIAHHGTAQVFDEFDPTKSFRGIGFQFAAERETAEFYAHGQENGRVVSCYLRMSNPYVLDLDERAEEIDGEKTEDELSGGDYYPNVPVDWFHKFGREEIRGAIAQGHDGYVLCGAEEVLYGVVSPLQIKSVDNCGLFLKDSPSISDLLAQKEIILKAMKALGETSGVAFDASMQAQLEASLPVPPTEENFASPFGLVTPADPVFIDMARQVSNQFEPGNPGHARVDDLCWLMVEKYPLNRLCGAPDAAWFRAEQKAWADTGEPDRFEDMLEGPIRLPVVAKEDGSQGHLWDGNHRVGAMAHLGKPWIPALVGISPELKHLFFPENQPAPETPKKARKNRP